MPKRGEIKDKIGEIGYNKFKTPMKIVEYKNSRHIIVEFQDEYKAKVHTQYGTFKNGNIKNPYDKSVFGIGYVGEGMYNKKDYPHIYSKWYNMLMRCYDPYFINKEPSYADCFVCEDWHNFQNFGKWFEENIYECNNEKMHLDKDILVKGNKIYSPENCVFVTNRINILFIKHDADRGKYPIGVCWDKENNKFKAQCQILDKENNRKQIYLGLYNISEDAFLAYKQYKESYIKQIADEYRELIPKKTL